MSDLKVFRKINGAYTELPGTSVAVEKSLQVQIETHLETFLGIQLVASEYSTGKLHGGRIDTLGLDENSAPVIIEYKRAVNENVINQGLYYLDWLLDHQAEFELLVLKKFGQSVSDGLAWHSTRLLCIAGDFKKFDEHAVRQINRNIELLRYKRYGEDLILFELINASTADPIEKHDPIPVKPIKTVENKFADASLELQDRYASLEAFILNLGDDVQKHVLKHYIAFRRIRNFVTAEFNPSLKQIVLFLRLDPNLIELRPGFSRDVSKLGHHGTGDLEIIVSSDQDLERAKELIMKSYESA